MDVEGYFPIYLLLFIPAIQQFGVDVDALAEILALCPLAEVDMSRMTVRPKTNWEQVRMFVFFHSSGLCRIPWAATESLATP